MDASESTPVVKPKPGSWSLDYALQQIASGKHVTAVAHSLQITHPALLQRAYRNCRRKYLKALSKGAQTRLNAILSDSATIGITLARERVNREYGNMVANIRHPTQSLLRALRLARAATKPAKSKRKRVDAPQQKDDLEQV